MRYRKKRSFMKQNYGFKRRRKSSRRRRGSVGPLKIGYRM